jgi:RNA polymerase sigma factor (sigma-70 family)
VEAAPDDPAWSEFVSRFHGWIRRITFRAYTTEAERNRGLDAGLPGEVIEDLTQEVFVRLIDGGRRALAHFEGRNEHSIYTYLCTIATNLVRDHFKKLRAQRTPPAARSLNEPLRVSDAPAEDLNLGDVLSGSSLSPEEMAHSVEIRKRIASAVHQASLGPTSKRDRLIFRLYFAEGLTLEEIAAIRSVKLSISGVEKRVRKIRSALKELLGKEEKEGG